MTIARHARRNRRGSAYIMCLGISMLVTAIGVATITVGRVQSRATESGIDQRRAANVAMAGLEEAVAVLNNDYDTYGDAWRSRYKNDEWGTIRNSAFGRFRWRVRDDADGNLTDDVTEPVTIEVQAEGGDVRRNITAELAFDPVYTIVPYTCFDATVASEGNAEFYLSSNLYGSGRVHTNANSNASLATVALDVTASGSVSGSTYVGSRSGGQDKLVLPSASIVSRYVALGTEIQMKDLDFDGTYYNLENVVLTPYLNPYGDTNADGIYWIDCGGADLRIRHSRIIGTIVVLNPGLYARVHGRLNWEPAITNYPALIVDDTFNIDFRAGDMTESGRGFNLNPVGAPWKGETDSSFGDGDTYPSCIRGIVFIDGDARIDTGGDAGRIEGHLFCTGQLIFESGSTLGMLDIDHFRNYPPPGFSDRTLTGYRPRLVEGSIAISQ